MDIRKLTAQLIKRRAGVLRGLAVAGLFGLAGFMAIGGGRAASFAANSEAEAGSLSGLIGAGDTAGASGGASVKFGSTGAVSTWPSLPPAQICGNQSVLGGGPTSAPAGAITVPAGNNSGVNFNQSSKTFWFAPGTHTLGTGQYDQIIPGAGSTYVGAPGAIIDGQNVNNYGISGKAANVTVRYLTIQNFVAPRDQGVVNHDAGTGWTIEYSTIINNKGAGLMGGRDNTYRYNCMKDNGQYAINSCCDMAESIATEISGFTIDHNEIVGNNTDDWETQVAGCGCTGGIKLWINSNVAVTNNYIHDNHGAGLWLDNNNRGIRVENNYISGNESEAIMAEAGYDFQIRYNNILNNTYKKGREFAGRGDKFAIGTIYVSESGSPTGYGLKYVPSVISNNNFDNNWGGVDMWENPNRYAGSNAHTHVSGTIKIGNLYTPGICDGTGNSIPAGVNKYDCRWSTENVIVESNTFRIDKAAIGAQCAGNNFCGTNGLFSISGCCDYAFPGYEIAWRMTMQQGNVFRNNAYKGDWQFDAWEAGNRMTWNNWRAAAPAVPSNTSTYSPPGSMGQDAGSTYTATP